MRIKIKLWQVVGLGIGSIGLLYACDTSIRSLNPDPNPIETLTCSATLDLSTCTLNDACVLNVSNCQNSLQSSKTLKFFAPIKRATENLVINSMTSLDLPSLLQQSPGVIPTEYFAASSPLSCAVDGNGFICENFAPIADHFLLEGTLGSVPVSIDLTVNTDGITPAPTTTVAKCGQYGVSDNTTDKYTTVQRMYDCSKRVTDYAGIGVKGAASTSFVLGTSNPDSNWFLVGCPDAGNKELCAWLSPIVQTGNSTIGINCNMGNCDPTSIDIQVGTRLVWSGVLTNGTDDHNFGQTNGSNSMGFANCDGNDQCAEYSGGGAGAVSTFQGLITTDNTGSADQTNLCTTQFAAKDASFSGMLSSVYAWQVPSYPEMLTISGFAGGGCDNVSLNCIPEGFSAISSPIPSFSTLLWSSSVFDSKLGWSFGSGNVDNGGSINVPLGVRCSSSAW